MMWKLPHLGLPEFASLPPLTRAQETRVRQIVREEIDAEDAWRRGPLKPGETMRDRMNRSADQRATAIAAGRREEPDNA